MHDFWEKCINNVENMQSVGQLIQLLCYENDYMSEIVATVLLHLIFRASFKNVHVVLEAM